MSEEYTKLTILRKAKLITKLVGLLHFPCRFDVMWCSIGVWSAYVKRVDGGEYLIHPIEKEDLDAVLNDMILRLLDHVRQVLELKMMVVEEMQNVIAEVEGKKG